MARRQPRAKTSQRAPGLRDREARLQAILDHAPTCLAVLGSEGELLEMNAAGLALLEADDLAQLGGRSPIDFVHPDDRAIVCQVREGTRSFRIVGLRGTVRWVEGSQVPLPDAGGLDSGVLAVLLDVTRQKQGDDLLRQAATALGSVLMSLPDLFFFVDGEGTILYFHAGERADLYLPPEQFLGRKFSDVLPAPVAAQLHDGIARVRTTGQPVTVEYTLPIQGGDGVFEGRLLSLERDRIVVVVRNITERMRAESALRASEEKYRRIVETAAEGIWTVDTSGRTTFVNALMAHLIGYEPRELIGRSAFDFLSEPSRAVLATTLERQGTAGERVEVQFVRSDGSTLWTLASGNAIRDDDGRFVGLLGMLTDVTERKEAESLMSAIVESSPNMIFVKRAEDLRFVAFNRAGEQLLGYRREEMLGKNDYDFFPDHEADFFTAKDREVLESGRVLEIPEEPILTRETGLRYLRTLKVPIRDPSGQPRYLLGISEDITERKQVDARLRQAEKMEAVGRLAGGIAHDFNNILGSVLGFGELLKADCAGNARAARNLETLLEVGERGKRLVEQISAFSRQEPHDLQPLDPGLTVANAVRLLHPTLPPSVSLETVIPADLPAILGDATQVYRLLANLATNGVQAMGEQGGRLTIVLDQCDITTDDLATSEFELFPRRYVRLLVSDTGRGMDARTVERIFEPFFTTKAPGHGTGLGLSVVHGIVKSHGGAIFVRSEPGQGTTFEVYLPTYDGPRVEDATGLAAVPQGHGEHILLVDDEAPSAEVGRSLLERLGYRVTAFTDAVAAVTAFRDRPEAYDLVVTDLTMPSLSGLEVAREVSRISPGARVLLNTAFSGIVTAETVRTAGACGLVAKPNTLETLARAVHEALEPARSPA